MTHGRIARSGTRATLVNRLVTVAGVKAFVAVRALVTVALAVVVLLATASSIAATALGARMASIACAVPANGRFPTISQLRVTHAGCTTARAVAEGIQAGWQANGKLPASFDLYAGGPVFHCRYEQHRGSENVYKAARCTSARKLVTMVLGS
jgi:hypothetical protein